MLLRYYDSAGIEADYNPRSGDVCLRPAADFRRLLRDAEGVITLLAGAVVVLAATPDGMVLRVGTRSGPLNDIDIDVSGHEGARVLEIAWPTGEVDRLSYAVTGWIEGDPTPGVEPEDFDFGLFLRNVRRDSARQRRMSGNADD